MNADRDVGRLLDLWIAEGIDEVNDRVLDTVEQRIGKQRQLPGWRLSWRDRHMNTYLKLAAGLAAVAIVAVVGYSLLPATPGPGAPSTGPTPTAIPTSTPAAASGPVALPAGALAGGRYRMELSFIDPGFSIVGDIPAGWIGHPEIPAVTSPEGSNAGLLISFMETDGLFSDPCHWDLDGTGSITQPGDVEVGPTVNDLVAALQANSSYTASDATPIIAGDHAGQMLELQLPGNDVIRSCDRRPGEGVGDYFVFPKGFYAQGPNSRWRLWISDVDGTRLITMLSIAEGTPEAEIAVAEAIVESFEITP